MSMFQKKGQFLFLCCFTYMCSYLCRVNLSTALERMGAALGATSSALGLLGAAYFLCYAFAQLVCGFFGDRVRPERLVCLGLTGIAATNLGVSFCTGYGAIMALWCANGVFQAMLWGPMSRLLAGRFSPGERVTASTFLSLSMPSAYILTWSVMAPLLAGSPWALSFRIPGAIILLPAVLWIALAADGGNGGALATVSTAKPSSAELLRTIREERLWLVAAGCLSNGILKESFTIWAPVILTRLLGMDAKGSALYLVLFPLCNAAMIALSGRILRRTGISMRLSLTVQCGLVAACAAVLMLVSCPAALTVVLMALISGFGYAANNIYMGVLPMCYAEQNITSTLVGLFDFSAYVGAGAASWGLGLLITGSDLTAIAAVWMGAAVVSLIALAFCRGRLAQRRAAGG